MDVIRDGDGRPRPEKATVVTIGAYDGVHVGHQAVIGRVRERAQAADLASAVVTFDRHPASVVRPGSAPLLLTDLEQKLELLAGQGLDHALVITFDRARSRESAEDFVAGTLVERLGARVVVVGQNFHFGHGRRGDAALLSACGRELGFEVEGLPLVSAPAQGPGVISSSRIRRLLSEGQVRPAALLLGRLHELRGVVAQGDGRASSLLGYPTANVAVPHQVLVPADGVYAGYYQRPDGSVHRAAISIGGRPTFYGPAASTVVEVHVLDGFTADLYGELARVALVERLGDQQRFESVDELVTQIGRDVEGARRALAAWP